MPRTGNEVEEEGFAAGPGEQCAGDRNGSLLVPFDEAADRDGLELGKFAVIAYMRLLSFVKDIGERVCRSARTHSGLGLVPQWRKPEWGLSNDAVRPR